MTIRILDTASGMRSVLNSPEAERAARLRSMLEPVADMYRYFPGEVDLLTMHTMGSGFPIDRSRERVVDGLDRLVAADAWARIERALDEALAVQLDALPNLVAPDITVLLVLGDPDDHYFMDAIRGFIGNGSATGFISLILWPTEENLARLEAAAVHELHHNLRYAPGGVVWDPATVVVGEQVVSEGLADAFARQLHGVSGYTPIGVAHLDDDAVFDRVVEGLEVGGMQHFVSWVHGDEAALRFGGEPVGLPMGAGYAAGNRLVDAYLSATGTTAAEALHVPSATIIKVALRELGRAG
jgi:uncharacterized protein YjaZ